MAFDLQEEDYEFNQAFGAQSDDEYEDYEEESEFDIYSEEDADARWGSLTFIQLVNELDNVLANSRKYFFSKKKRVVDAELAVNLAKTISDKLPSQFEEAESILAQSDEIISNARNDANARKTDADVYYNEKISEADSIAERIVAKASEDAKRIVSAAQAHADQLVADHTITNRALENEQKIIEQANVKAEGIVNSTKANCQQYIEQLSNWGGNNVEGVIKFVNKVIETSIQLNQKNIESINSDIDNLSDIKNKFNAAADKQKDILTRPPMMGK